MTETGQLTQRELNRRVKRWLETGNSRSLGKIALAYQDGDLLVNATAHAITIKVVDRPSVLAFGAKLSQLRATSPLTLDQLAAGIGVSSSTISRLLKGMTLTQWPVVSSLVTHLGGDPDDFRPDFDTAKREQRARNASRRRKP